MGVVSLDINLNDALEKEARLDGDDYSYYFLIGANGGTYYHPMLPSPTHPWEPPVMVFIGILEQEAVKAGIIASMLRYGLYWPHDAIICV